jgi:HD superfamily phosphodiesterase
MSLPPVDESLLEFCRVGYKPYDESHDLNHALQVYKNAALIVQDAMGGVEYCRAVRDTAMIHDIDDYKYKSVQTVSMEDIVKFLQSRHEQKWVDRIVWTVQNMSWSKASKVDYNSGNYHAGLFHVCRDADWVEAIDVTRCIAYQKSRGYGMQAVVAHVNEKLLHVRDRLHWDVSKELAKDKQEKLEAWMDKIGVVYK